MSYDIFGETNKEIYNDSKSERIGRRIRYIRKEKGLTTLELGNMVGLDADRVRKYENGYRAPKEDLLRRFAKALDVSVYALADPVGTNSIGAMYTMFELEKVFDMTIERRGGNRPPGMSLTVDFRNDMYHYMEEWYNAYKEMQTHLEKAETDEEKQKAVHDYNMWKWTFPDEIKIDKKKQKDELQKKIAELQEEYNRLDEE